MVTVERLPEEDAEARATVVRTGKAAFPFPQSALLHETDHVFVARHEGDVVGGTIAEVFEPTPGRTVGLVTWIFTTPGVRGLGVGKRLAEQTITHLEGLGCEAVVAAVRWQNTSSSKLFASEGFVRTSTGRLLAEYGVLGTARFYLDAMYLGPGWELWTKGLEDATGDDEASDADATPDRRRALTRFAGSAVANVSLFVVATLSVLGVDAVTGAPAAVVSIPLAIFLARHLPSGLAAVTDPETWTFRTWENAYPPGLLLAALGLYVPVPGNIAPTRRVWTFREKLPVLGPAAAVSSALLVGLYGLFLLPEVLPFSLPAGVADLVVYTLWTVLVVEVLFVTFPFNTYTGRVVYDWNRSVWAILAAATVVVLVGAAVDTGLVASVVGAVGS